ncbi:MAG: CTP synthase [Pseudomonadota bacterium]
MAARLIFITGGVVSSLGKGIAASALGSLLQAHGYKVRLRKLDPYLNVDPGTMNPYEHGECFVTEDGAETDLDLGHYERFTGVSSKSYDNVTSGQIYHQILKAERQGDFLGKTVQVIPHVTDAIKSFIQSHHDHEDFIICEIGGTVGDIESLPFIEAIRQYANEISRERTAFIHVTLVPYIKSASEIKTKPTQHSVKELLSLGIQPDFLLCRVEQDLPSSARKKIALFCNIPIERVIPAIDAQTIYQVPILFHNAGFDTQILTYFGMQKKRNPNLTPWKNVVSRISSPKEGRVKIAVVGKYATHLDAYKSLNEALIHGAIANDVELKLTYLVSDLFEDKNPADVLVNYHGVLVPGGFGQRGTIGMQKVIEFCRVNHLPFFGICFGMQMAIIEIARNLAKLKYANSREFYPKGNISKKEAEQLVVCWLDEWIKDNYLEKRSMQDQMGGSMRLGTYPCLLKPHSKIASIYKKDIIHERHRHRYEVNVAFKEQLEKVGVCFSGTSPDMNLPEIIELKEHPWFIGVQFHPELKSRPFSPHPLFTDFILAALQKARLI